MCWLDPSCAQAGQGSWRRDADPPQTYERLVLCGVSSQLKPLSTADGVIISSRPRIKHDRDMTLGYFISVSAVEESDKRGGVWARSLSPPRLDESSEVGQETIQFAWLALAESLSCHSALGGPSNHG